MLDRIRSIDTDGESSSKGKRKRERSQLTNLLSSIAKKHCKMLMIANGDGQRRESQRDRRATRLQG